MFCRRLTSAALRSTTRIPGNTTVCWRTSEMGGSPTLFPRGEKGNISDDDSKPIELQTQTTLRNLISFFLQATVVTAPRNEQ